MVVAQLVERLLLTPEVCGSNPVIGKIYIERLLSTILKLEETKRNENKKRPGMALFKTFLNVLKHQLGLILKIKLRFWN